MKNRGNCLRKKDEILQIWKSTVDFCEEKVQICPSQWELELLTTFFAVRILSKHIHRSD
jgi:hypothetical protein